MVVDWNYYNSFSDWFDILVNLEKEVSQSKKSQEACQKKKAQASYVFSEKGNKESKKREENCFKEKCCKFQERIEKITK